VLVDDDELAGVDAPDVAKAGAIIVSARRCRRGEDKPPRCSADRNITAQKGTFEHCRGTGAGSWQAKAAPGFGAPSWYALSDARRARAGTNLSLASGRVRPLAKSHAGFAGMRLRPTLGLKGRTVPGVTSGAE